MKFGLIAFIIASLIGANVFAQSGGDEFAEMVNEYKEDGEILTYLRKTSVEFEENHPMKVGAFVNVGINQDKSLARIGFYACGIEIRDLGDKNFKGILDTHKRAPDGRRVPNVGFLEFYEKPLLGTDVKDATVTFEKGSAEKCKDYPHKYFLFDFIDNNGGPSVRYKMKFNIVEKYKINEKEDKKEKDDGAVKVSKISYDKAKSVCDGIDMKTLNTIRTLSVTSAVSSGFGAAANIAGLTMGAISIANNKKGNKGNSDLNNKLDIGQTVTSSIGAATSGTALGSSSAAAVKIKKLISDIEACKNAVKRLVVISD